MNEMLTDTEIHVFNRVMLTFMLLDHVILWRYVFLLQVLLSWCP